MGPFTDQRSAFSLFSPERDAFGRPAPPAATRTDGNLPAIFRITWWMDSNSSELPSGGTTTQRKGESLIQEPNNATKCDDFRDLSRAPAAPPASGPKPIKTALRCGAPPVRCP